MGKDLKEKSHKEWLKPLELFSLEETEIRPDHGLQLPQRGSRGAAPVSALTECKGTA